MQRRSLFLLTVIIVLLIVLAFPLSLAAQEDVAITSTSDILDISQPRGSTPLENGTTTLVRQADGVSMMFHTFDLTPGEAFTTWWVIDGSSYFADGQVIGDDGVGLFTAFLSIDDVERSFDPMEAEIHLIARTHGPVIPDLVDEMISTADGGCDMNTCVNVQESIHLAPAMTEQAATGQAAQNAENAERVIEEIWNEPDRDARRTAGDELYFSSFTWHSATSDRIMPCPLSTFLNSIVPGFHNGISDMQMTIEGITSNDERATVEYILTGTLDGRPISLPDGTRIAPTGEPVTWEGVFIYRFEDGKIIEEWWYWDNPFAE